MFHPYFDLGVPKVVRDDNYAGTYEDHRCNYTYNDKKSRMDTFLYCYRRRM